jgi:histidinol-phosphate aminotransferase
MMACDLAPAHVRTLLAYQPGKPIEELAREFGLAAHDIVKLASNENPLGSSPRALLAIDQALPEMARYPDGNGYVLKSALSRKFSVQPAQIVLGNGSNDVLDLAARTFLHSGASAVFAQHAFAVYPLVTQAAGARGICVPAKEYGHDLEAMLAAIVPDTRLVFIANPNNPTGTLLSNEALLFFLQCVPPQVLVVLDEAYGEYLPENLRSKSMDWLAEFPNLLVTKTFSKAYGLAGLRIGYALAHPDVAELMNRVRQPFNVSSLGLVAAAAALDDDDFIARGYAANRLGMAQLTQGLRNLGIGFIPSEANFLACRIGNASMVYQRLLAQGVIVRPIAAYGMPEFLRVSVGLAAENERFLQALKTAIEEQ